MKIISRFFSLCILYCLLPGFIFAETIGVFYDQNLPQIKFAAGDIKTVLEAKGYTVEELELSSLSLGYTNKKVVVTLATNSKVIELFNSMGGITPNGLTEQSYNLFTTTQGATSHWIIGGDENGAMYGGFQLAENISFSSFGGS
jgi:hypothetical protein